MSQEQPASPPSPIFRPPPEAKGVPEVYSTRPCVALSEQLYRLLRHIMSKHCLEKRRAMPPPLHHGGFDDKDGHYISILGEEIAGRYIVQQVLGRGSFGTVLRCFDQHLSLSVALKVARRGNYFLTQAEHEVTILRRLNENPRLRHLVVRMQRTLMWQGHAVIVMELLSFSLYQLVKLSRYNGVSLDLTRKFAYQLLFVLMELEQYPDPILHCDLKPENVLLYDSGRSGLRVVDFGSACCESWGKHKYIQSRYYRAPEVILGRPYTTAIDRWSLGCFLVEMHTGTPLLPGRSEAEQLARMEALFGKIPHEMVASTSDAKRDAFFTRGEEGGVGSPSAVAPPLADGDPPPSFSLKTPPMPTYPTSLFDVMGVTTGGPRGCRRGFPGHDETSYGEFYDFVKRLLRYEPSERMSCYEALQHPFIQPLFAASPTAPPPTAAAPSGQERKTAAKTIATQPTTPWKGKSPKP